MKIGVITIVLIFLFLTTLIGTYFDKKTLNMQNDLCQEMRSNESYPIENFSDASWNLLQKCYTERQIYSTKYSLMSSVTFILFMLVLLSWRIDLLEKKSK